MTIKDMITEADYALQRGVSVRTVQRDRALRTGPAFIKLGKKIFYRPESIEAWLLANEQQQVRSKVRA